MTGAILILAMLATAVCHAQDFEWERHKCAICGKAIWEKIEYTDLATDGMVVIGTDLDGITFDSIVDDPHVPVEYLSYHADQKVCPHCRLKYAEDYKVTMRNAMHNFIEHARIVEIPRRKEVAEQNTQEEIRRVEAQLKAVAEQLKAITAKLDELKGSDGSSDPTSK